MSISLPYLFVAGCFAAPFGVLLLLAQFRWASATPLAAGLFGGGASVLLLLGILAHVGKDFMGWHRPAAWAIAFFAGYAVASLLAYVGMAALRLRITGA